MTADDHAELVLRMPRELAIFHERSIWDLHEHLAGGREIVPGPPELERELAALMWDVREALGVGHLYDAKRPPSARPGSYVVS